MTDDEALQLEIERRACIHTASEMGGGDGEMDCGISEMNHKLRQKAKDIENMLIEDGRLIHAVSELANLYWVLGGKPNGEEYRNSKWGRIKIKDIHWRRAEEVYNLNLPKADW